MWSRRPSLPDDVRRHLDRRDRVLAVAPLRSDAGWAVATEAELLVVHGDKAQRRPWCDVDTASFDPRHGVVTVVWVDDAPDLAVRVAEPSKTRLPQVVRERVEWSVVLGEEVPLPEGRSARVAVRRELSGPLFSQVVAGPGVDLDNPEVARLVDAAEQRVRSAAGLPA